MYPCILRRNLWNFSSENEVFPLSVYRVSHQSICPPHHVSILTVYTCVCSYKIAVPYLCSQIFVNNETAKLSRTRLKLQNMVVVIWTPVTTIGIPIYVDYHRVLDYQWGLNEAQKPKKASQNFQFIRWMKYKTSKPLYLFQLFLQ